MSQGTVFLGWARALRNHRSNFSPGFIGSHSEGDFKPRGRLSPPGTRTIRKLPVQQSADVSSVGECQQSRAVPRFHRASRPVVEVPLLGRHGLVILPGLRHHGHHGLGQRTLARVDQELQYAVRRSGVRQVRLHNRVQLFDVVKVLALHHALPRGHEVHVAAHRVYLSVVRQHSAANGAFRFVLKKLFFFLLLISRRAYIHHGV